MIRRFYSGPRAWRHMRSCIAALTLFVGSACGGAAPKPSEPVASSEVEALLDAATAAESKRDYNRARELFEEAIAAARDDDSAALANREMASSLAFWGEYEAAEARLRQSLSHKSEQARVWHDLGLIQDHQGKGAEALESLSQAVRLAPKEPRVRVALAALLVKQERYADAIEHYEVLLSLPIPERIERATRKALVLLKQELASQAGPG